jgi:hypothetical protein
MEGYNFYIFEFFRTYCVTNNDNKFECLKIVNADRFKLDEWNTAAKLSKSNCPNVIKYLSCKQLQLGEIKFYGIFMEYAEGGVYFCFVFTLYFKNLTEFLNNFKTFEGNLKILYNIFKQICLFIFYLCFFFLSTRTL